MDYGKTAYLKTTDLERRLSLGVSESQYDSYLELSKGLVDETFSGSSKLELTFPKFKPTSNSLCFQVKPNLTSTIEGNISVSILINNISIYSEERALSKGDNEFLLLKTYRPIGEDELEVKLIFEAKTELLSATVKSVSLIVLGASGESVNLDIELKAIKLDGGRALVSFIDDNKLYYLITQVENKSLSRDDFTFHSNATAHCIAKASFTSDEINLYRVYQNRLYLSKLTGGQERVIAEDVKCVSASPCPNVSDDTNIVVYIKTDGSCYYKTLRGESIVSERKLSLPRGNYTSISAISHPDSEFIYIIACHENGSNYILRSLVEVSTGKVTEMLKASYMATITRYVDLSFSNKKTTENLKAAFDILLSIEHYYSAAIERLSKDHLKLSYSASTDKYKVVRPIIYGVKIDPALYKDPFGWMSYVDDCVGLEPATMDLNNSIFTSNGWDERWPYNELRPCIVKDGKVLGYLKKEDYSQFEDGSPADITNRKAGNVMVEFPKIYYKISKKDGYIYLNLSNKCFEGYCKDAYIYKGVEYDKLYISAYLCGTSIANTEGLYSNSGTKITTSKKFSFDQFYRNFQNKNTDKTLDFLTYHQVHVLQIMYAIMFKTTKWNNYYCKVNDEDIYSAVQGRCDQCGMYFGYKQSNKGNKVFGLESLAGHKKQMVVGMYVDKNGKIRIANVNDPNLNYDPAYKDSYDILDEDYVLADESFGCALDINGSNHTGFFYMKIDGKYDIYSDNYGFCGKSGQYLDSDHVEFGYSQDYTNNSLFTYMAHTSENAKACTTRLVCYTNNLGE